METITRPEGTRPAEFTHIYNGKFVDRNKETSAAGILTYTPGDNVKTSIRQQINSAPIQTKSTIEKFRNYTSPNLGEIRLHYGHADDPKIYESITHGIKSGNSSITTKDCVNPRLNTRFQQLQHELNERAYMSNHSAPLGRVPAGVLPLQIKSQNTFGMPSKSGVSSAKECLNPDKPRYQVELETSSKHDMYVFSHDDYEPGEQVDRVYSSSFDRYKRYGEPTKSRYDGKYTRDSLDWTLTNNPKRITRSESMLIDGFREKTTSQIGKALDYNKDTRFVGPDHVFGLTNQSDLYSAGDVIHYRQNSSLKGKDRERAYLASIRSNLARFNLVKFKTLVDAFDYYDKDKDGYINRDELKIGCSNAGCPVADNLLDLVMRDCDYDRDGKIGFLEFCNFLCYKDSMKTGIIQQANDNKEIRDKDGRFLLFETDLVSNKNKMSNELVPRTLVNQIDEKVGSWKTTYDILNDAPFRLEPLTVKLNFKEKRVYGIPSIRTDILPPAFKKIQDRTNYGNDGSAWDLLTPSVFSQHCVYESDVLMPRPKEEIRLLIKNSGIKLSDQEFDQIWFLAQNMSSSSDGVSFNDFRQALDRYKNY